jgi:hypothetical protein
MNISQDFRALNGAILSKNRKTRLRNLEIHKKHEMPSHIT